MPTIRLAGSQASLFAFPALNLDEFVPIVQMDGSGFRTENTAAIIEQKQTLELSEKIEAAKRKIDLITLVVAPGELKIPFKVERGVSTLDDDGYITPKVVGTARGVVLQPFGPIKTSIGAVFEITVEVAGSEKREFAIEFYANDNEDDANKGEFKDVFCGKLAFQVYPDVFSEGECDKLIDEIDFIKPFADSGSPSEYAGNYCMAAAERGLSKLLENESDFYSVDRSHKKLNSVEFGGKGAKDRGADFASKGYVITSFSFSKYQIDHALRKKITSDSDLSANLYKVVTLNAGSELRSNLEKSISGKRGCHVYYISVSDDFHTLLLVVDNRDSKNEVYAIYDQHGKTSSHGNFSDIEAGFARQTSWTFLNFYANKGYRPDVYGGVTTRVWKIQRKQ